MSARKAAYIALRARRDSGLRLDIALRKEIRDLSSSDKSLATRLCYGVVQTEALLDLGLQNFITPQRTSSQAMDILRIGAYQAWFCDRIPRYALVNESVELAKLYCGNASGMINAVLKRLPEKPPVSHDPLIKYSISRWIYTRVHSRLGKQTDDFFTASNINPKVTLHKSPFVKAVLPQNAVKHKYLPDCVELSDAAGMGILLNTGWIAADAAARLCIIVLGAKPGQAIWDVCAAPGGKSILTAFGMGNRGEILSTDISEPKLKLINGAARRLGVGIIQTTEADARNHKPDKQFDAVLCDVPCSGLGVLRKKPDIRYKDEKDAVKLPRLQKEILQNAANAVKPGGTLLYSTCTVLREENEAVIESFLGKNGGFQLEKFNLPDIGECAGMITLWPHIHNTDGFFICKMRRKEV